MPARLLQCNLNHCRAAQDLLVQTVRQWGVGLTVIAEPYQVLSRPDWAGDLDGVAAITWSLESGAPACDVIHRGRGFVAVAWGELAVIGCYASPTKGLRHFEAFLDEVGQCIASCQPRPVVVLGDFNSHAVAWGSPRTTPKGDALLEWSAGHGLVLLNQGTVSTCVHARGESIVDLSFASPGIARRVSGWRVAEEVATLSDHLYITMDISATPTSDGPRRQHRSPRWAIKRLQQDTVKMAASVVAWPDMPGETLDDPELGARWFREVMTSICDATLPRAGAPRQGSVYWWSAEIADLRTRCVRARRRYTRARHNRRATEEEVLGLRREFSAARRTLRLAIFDAKTQAWKELLDSLNADPWGRPYKMVLRKLRPWAPPLTERMDPQQLRVVVSTLFPSGGEGVPPVEPSDRNIWSDELGVTEEELSGAIRRLAARNTAPGPDGIPGRVWVIALGVLRPGLKRLFDACLRSGRFPPSWKRARLVLLHKEGKPADSPSSYRPICLLDEAGKLLERVVASRLVGHLSRVGPDLSEAQYGFRQGRSTVDAVSRVRALTEPVVTGGGVALAISLDIANAFNTISWAAIGRALEHHRVPGYLGDIVRDYLRDRSIEWVGREGREERRVHRGVPQGSVLGPLLWNMAYDAVWRVELPGGVTLIGYADDTMIIVVGEEWRGTVRVAEEAVHLVVAKIESLGLQVAPAKTEAMWLCGTSGRGVPSKASIRIGGVCVPVGRKFKYLGLTVDSYWRFGHHFDLLAPRLERAAAALCRLAPNLGGPGEGVRRLYVGVVRSMALYGAPIWAGGLAANRRGTEVLRKVHRLLAVRVVRGYRTISYAAATVLAGSIPFSYLAVMDAEVFAGLRAPCQVGGDPSERQIEEDVRRQAGQRAWGKWLAWLDEPQNSDKRVVRAVRPLLKEWVGRQHGRLTYHLTQMLTGHGCFGEYLCRIGKEATTRCYHCDGEEDTAQHTLEFCPAWAVQRRVLRCEVGGDLSLPTVVREMVGSERSWKAVASFCEEVLTRKEAAEREREGERARRPTRRRPRRR